MLSATTGTSATEHSPETQLADVLNQQAGQTGEYEVKVLRSEIIDYTYTWQGKDVASQKIQVILQSHIPEQYCLGVAKLQKKDKHELQQIFKRFPVGATWKFTEVKLLDEKTVFFTLHVAL